MQPFNESGDDEAWREIPDELVQANFDLLTSSHGIDFNTAYGERIEINGKSEYIYTSPVNVDRSGRFINLSTSSLPGHLGFNLKFAGGFIIGKQDIASPYVKRVVDATIDKYNAWVKAQPSHEELPVVSPKDMISKARDFDGLYATLREIGSITGSQKTYSSDELIDIISKVRAGQENLDLITSSCGLRKKVRELLQGLG